MSCEQAGNGKVRINAILPLFPLAIRGFPCYNIQASHIKDDDRDAVIPSNPLHRERLYAERPQGR